MLLPFIVGVDVGGMPCDMDALNEIGERYGIYVISDCAQFPRLPMEGERNMQFPIRNI